MKWNEMRKHTYFLIFFLQNFSFKNFQDGLDANFLQRKKFVYLICYFFCVLVVSAETETGNQFYKLYNKESLLGKTWFKYFTDYFGSKHFPFFWQWLFPLSHIFLFSRKPCHGLKQGSNKAAAKSPSYE